MTYSRLGAPEDGVPLLDERLRGLAVVLGQPAARVVPRFQIEQVFERPALLRVEGHTGAPATGRRRRLRPAPSRASASASRGASATPPSASGAPAPCPRGWSRRTPAPPPSPSRPHPRRRRGRRP